MALIKRKIRLRREEDLTHEKVEEALNHFDKQVTILDERRIAQQTALESDATTSDIINAINNLFDALNGSDLTED